MLEKITGTFSGIIRTLSGKSSITEKNIEETVEQIKMALLEADVNLRVVRRFVNSTIHLLIRPRHAVQEACAAQNDDSSK